MDFIEPDKDVVQHLDTGFSLLCLLHQWNAPPPPSLYTTVTRSHAEIAFGLIF